MNNRIKIILIVFITLLVATITPLADQVITLKIDGTESATEISPVIIDNRVMVPLRYISESLGATVTWDNLTKTVSVASSTKRFTNQLQEKGMYLKEAEEVLKMVESNEAVIVDVRSQELRNISYIHGSIHIPITELIERITELPGEKIIAVYCTRNISAAYAVAVLNMSDIESYILLDGMEAWEAAGGENVICRR